MQDYCSGEQLREVKFWRRGFSARQGSSFTAKSFILVRYLSNVTSGANAS